ncbi:MAG: hypothetical protein KGS60_10755 [Verrucomicrobia bacterium]|nr:hypothetical protein [Verrucomicrobiota bacterium]
MEFFSSDRTTFARQVRLANQRDGAHNEFIIWAAIIAILAALCAFSWTFCLYVFGRPENAFNYNLLLDLGKLPQLKDYQPGNAPRGRFHTPRDLYQLYFNNDARSLRALSAVLRRQFITNFSGVERVTYLRGTFLLRESRRLGPGDLFPSGWAFRGPAEDYPDVVVEYLLPAPVVPDSPPVPGAKAVFEVGGSAVCAAVINVAKLGQNQLVFTAVPIVYGDHEAISGTVLRLEPPVRLDLKGNLPVFREAGTAKP